MFDAIRNLIKKIKGNSLAKNSAVFFAGTFVASVGGYLFHFLMARMLDIETYGEVQSLMALFTIFSIPASALTTVIVKYTATFSARKETGKIRALFTVFTKKLLAVGFALFVIFSLLSRITADFLQIDSVVPLVILNGSFLVVFLSAVNSGILQGLQKFKSISVISIIGAFAKLFLAFLLVKLSFGLNGVQASLVLCGVFGYLITFFPLRFLFQAAEKKNSILTGQWSKFKDKYLLKAVSATKDLFSGRTGEKIDSRTILKYSLPVFFSLLFTSLLFNLDLVLVKHFLPPELAGQYGALAIIGHVIFFVTGPIISVMFPMVAHNHANGSGHSSILKNAFLLMSFIGASSLAVYFLMPGLIIKILVGSKFLAVAPYLGWYGLAMLSYSFISLLTGYLLSIHLTKYVFILGTGALLQISMFSFWHESLGQIVLIMNITMAFTLFFLAIFSYQKLRPIVAE